MDERPWPALLYPTDGERVVHTDGGEPPRLCGQRGAWTVVRREDEASVAPSDCVDSSMTVWRLLL